jgi:acetate kinase
MNPAILVLNAGSSSIKFALFETVQVVARDAVLHGQVDGIGTEARLSAVAASGERLTDLALPQASRASLEEQHREALDHLLRWLDRHDGAWRISAVGHRVVHGGVRYAAPLRVDEALLGELETLIPLAPLHQPHNLNAVRALMAVAPGVPQVACFDTAFHRSQPAVAQAYALPRTLTAKGIRRYGFHGLSYEYIARVLPEQLGERADGRVVVAHLGNGVSMCAMRARRSVATTMGFTALEGLVMGTRCGSLDPGVLLYLMESEHMDAAQLTDLLYRRSGLLGVSGISQDMRTLLASDAPEAQEAVALFCYRIVRELGSLAAALGGLDALVFTGGIGEHAAAIRSRVCGDAGWLGLRLDTRRNASHATRIGADNSDVDVLVLPTNEEWIIADHTARLLAADPTA